MTSLESYIEDDTNINTKINILEERINIDLDLSVTLDTINYNSSNNRLTINFLSNLSSDDRKILDTLISIIIFDKIPGFDILSTIENNERRKSLFSDSIPTRFHDINSGYVNGSIVINNNIPYMCTDNTQDNAVWVLLTLRQKDKNYTGRNWSFSTDGSALGSVIGLELRLEKPSNRGLIERRFFTRFMREVDEDVIYRIRMLLYSDRTFDLAITIDQCPNNVNGTPTQIYPRSGIDEIININGNSKLVGQTRNISGTNNSESNCPNYIEFEFDPPIAITDSSVAMYLSSVTTSGSNFFTIGVWQLSIITIND
jgi:hypothetical protein